MITLKELQEKYPNWEIDPPHFMAEREGSEAGEVGYDAHWRQFANPKHATSKYTIIAFGKDESECLEDMAARLKVKDAAYAMEL